MTDDSQVKINMLEGKNLSKTYKDIAGEFVHDNVMDGENGTNAFSEEEIKGIHLFAEHLDSKNVLTHQLEMLAVLQARKIDREFMELLIEAVGLPKAKELALIINKKHRTVSCREAQNQDESKSSESEQSENSQQ
jgi:hypothetical protein